MKIARLADIYRTVSPGARKLASALVMLGALLLASGVGFEILGAWDGLPFATSIFSALTTACFGVAFAIVVIFAATEYSTEHRSRVRLQERLRRSTQELQAIFRGTFVDPATVHERAGELSYYIALQESSQSDFVTYDQFEELRAEELDGLELELLKSRDLRRSWLEIFSHPREVSRALERASDEWAMLRSLRTDVSIAGFEWVGSDLQEAFNRELLSMNDIFGWFQRDFESVEGLEAYLGNQSLLVGQTVGVLRQGGLGAGSMKMAIDSLAHLSLLVDHLVNTFSFTEAVVEARDSGHGEGVSR